MRAKQRLRHLSTDALDGEVATGAHVSRSVFLQDGKLHEFSYEQRRSSAESKHTVTPYICRAYLLEEPSASAYYSALRDRLPFDLEDNNSMAEFFDTADWSWLQFAIDRDGSNALVLNRVADRMEEGTTNG